jgi:peroxiredoxin
MRRLGLAALVLTPALLTVPAAALFRDEPKRPAPARKVGDFRLPDAAGKVWSLGDFKDRKAVVVVFLGTECPVNNAYAPRLAELHKELAPKGVAFLGINSNCQDTAGRIAAHAKRFAIPFPVLKDTTNVVADQFGARRTPEAFVLAPDSTVLYQGRIDDQFGVGVTRKEPTRRDLAAAAEEVLAGKPVSVPSTEPAGCLIARAVKPKEGGAVTYAKQVSRILQARCQECHRPGQIGPMPLLTYQDALAWSGMIQEVVSEGRMPPWHADPRHGTFSNDRRLSKQEKADLLAWIDGGCPKGDPGELPPPRTFAEGWRIGKPDVVLEMGETFTVPAEVEGGLEYQYFTVPTRFKEDRWVQAAEARPGNRSVVHHIIVYVVPPGQGRGVGLGRGVGQGQAQGRGQDRGRGQRGPDGIGQGLLVAHAPGDLPLVLPAGTAKRVPKGSLLIFQMHYTPNGREQDDRSSVGLAFAKGPPQYEAKTRSVAQRRLNIPPREGNHEVRSAGTFERDAELISLMPHMHLRGKDFTYRVVFPDGKAETLLSVPRYDFGWQSNYRLAKPLALPKGTRIECTAHFDNSAENPNNPDPNRWVRWGDQTWQEMMIGFVDYRVPVEKR